MFFVFMLCLGLLFIIYSFLLIHVSFGIMHSDFNLLVFPNSMYTPIFQNEMTMCSHEKWHFKITIIINIIWCKVN